MNGIYLYWEGTARPWYYSLCLRTVLKHNPHARLLGRQDVEDVIGPIPPELDKVYIIHRVDWIRKKFIEAVGGLWLDMDFICFRSLDSLAALANDFDYVGYREWPGNQMDNFFAGRKGSRVLHDAADHALEQVRRFGRDVSWLATNAESIDHAMQRNAWSFHIQIPTHLISPVTVMDPHWFCADKAPWEDVSGYQCFGFITSYHGLRGWLASQSEEEFLSGRSRLASLFQRSLA
jgi:hypothetical protein